MPQPPLEVARYLSSPLPSLREQYPPGTGGTGPRAEWPEGTLKGVQVIDGFERLTTDYVKSLPTEPVQPHPAHKYPMFVQAITTIPTVIKSPSDLQKCTRSSHSLKQSSHPLMTRSLPSFRILLRPSCPASKQPGLSTLPLGAVSSVLNALDNDSSDEKAGPVGAEALDRAGYESDGGEEPSSHAAKSPTGPANAWQWRFSKSPLGSGEFLLMRQGSEDVHLVVRTINSAAFSSHDWDEFVVTGPYQYTTKSKASWYWSRTWGATKRLGCRYWILTDWQRWVYGCFDEERTHGWVSGIMRYDATEPSVLQTLTYWSKSAMGAEGGFRPTKKDVTSLPPLFPANPARRVSVSGSKRPKTEKNDNKVRAANESDIEESDAEGADGS